MPAAVDRPPALSAPAEITVDERERLELVVEVHDPDSEDVRVFAKGLPPGARWSEPTRTLTFTPDFIQGSDRWTVTFVADDGHSRVQHASTIEVRDSIVPPWPTVVQTQPANGYTRLVVEQTTDEFLDAPARAGRRMGAIVTRPIAATRERSMPVVVLLHGFLEEPHRTGDPDVFIVGPADPDNSYWWGYAREASHGETATVPPYTQRRVLHLLEWVLRHEPAADPERVFIAGRSMGGTGAATLGLLRARHFAGVDAWLWQAIPRNHRPLRIKQLRPLWGDPAAGWPDGEPGELSAWDRMDLTRALLAEPEARNQWLFSRHAKDDVTIHFGAAVLPSPLTEVSLYDALQQTGAGHWAVWDEGGHSAWDPQRGANWWDDGWDPRSDGTTFLRRDLAFVGFSGASHDDEPGDGGDGTRAFDEHRGFAGVVSRPDDTGWDGDVAGMLNRALRWDARALVDEIDRFEVPLRVLGDHAEPVVVDVTLRRVQAFMCRPGERVNWSLGEAEGEAVADEHGDLTIVDTPVTTSWETLVVTRRE